MSNNEVQADKSSLENLLHHINKLSLTEKEPPKKELHAKERLLASFKQYDPEKSRVYPDSQPTLCKEMELIGSVLKTRKKKDKRCHDYDYQFHLKEGNYDGLAVIHADLRESFQNDPMKLSKQCFKRYIPSNLENGFQSYIPISPYELVSPKSFVEFLIKYEQKYKIPLNKSTAEKKDFLYVTRRHHLTSLASSLFLNESTQMDLVLFDGLLILHEGRPDFGGIHSSDQKLAHMCYHGFALENLLTKDTQPDNEGHYYIYNKCILDNGKEIFLQAELDAMLDSSEKVFAELKCTVPLNPYSSFHAMKLLKMWLQTGFLPNTELVLGIRKRPDMNILRHIKNYKRSDIFDMLKSFNDKNPNRGSYYYNPLLACEWLNHVTNTIDTTLKDHLAGSNPIVPVAFRLTIDKYKNLKIDSLEEVPENVITDELLEWRKSVRESTK
ncbi:hypothetical protein ACO0QE_004633 [Hanseniaspora vineae]